MTKSRSNTSSCCKDAYEFGLFLFKLNLKVSLAGSTLKIPGIEASPPDGYQCGKTSVGIGHIKNYYIMSSRCVI